MRSRCSGDGIGDGLEVATGSDPLDPSSYIARSSAWQAWQAECPTITKGGRWRARAVPNAPVPHSRPLDRGRRDVSPRLRGRRPHGGSRDGQCRRADGYLTL
jgi:hypothetical protein